MTVRNLVEGDVFAGYRIESLLGQGGMGVVYLVEHLGLGRKVALKVLPPQLAGDARFRERFVRESRLAASLDHPNVIPIYEAGEADGRLFLAMRYVEGTDLSTLISSEGRLEPGRAIRILRQVAGALDAAHARGLVHRDVKPGNVLIARPSGSEAGEHVYLTDFGLTKRAASDSGITETGQFVGTFDYAAPEQFEGTKVDERTDVYSLGCVLYECMAGRPPFRRENEAAVLYAHLMEPPPPITAERPDLPEGIDAVLARAMAKKPEDRYQSAGAMTNEAARALGLEAGELRAPRVSARRRLVRRARRRPKAAAGTGVAVVAIVAVVAVLLPRVLGSGGVAGSAFKPGTVLLDIGTGKQIGFISSSRLAEPAYPLFSGGHFWVNNFAPSSFVEIDPRTGKVLKQFALPSRGVDNDTNNPYAVDGTTLWVTAGRDLVKMDIPLGREVDRFDLNEIVGKPGVAEGVVVGGGLVWVSRDVGLGQVVGLDPATGKVEQRFDDVPHHFDLAYGDGVLWAADRGGVVRIDPTTSLVTEARDIGVTGQSVAAGGGFGWTTDPSKGVVYKIDRNGRVVATYETGSGASGPHFVNGVLWVTNQDVGTVSAIDAITGKKTTYRFGHPVLTAAAGGGVLMAWLGPGRTFEDRIDALTGNVVKLFSQQGELGQGDEPALNWNPAAFQIEFATCAKLLNYPDEPAPEGWQLQPEVATAMPDVSPDGRTYTFTIRPGYRFSPPTDDPVTAETFRYSIERALSPKLGDFQPGAFLVGDIEGEQAFRDGKAEHISGLRADGDRLSITLVKPSNDFLERLALPFFCPVPTDTPTLRGGLLKGDTGVVGGGYIPSAGPYFVAGYANEEYVILKRNPNYRGPRPHALDAIALREGVDAAVAVDRVQHEGWDGIVSSGQNGPAPFDPLLEPQGPLASKYGKVASTGDQYVPVPLPQMGFLALNVGRGLFADPTVRRAAALALDRTALAAVWGEDPTDQFLPPIFPGARDRELFPLEGSLDEARALLKGREETAVMAIYPNCDPCRQEADAVRAQLGQIGIHVQIKEFADASGAAGKRGARIDILDDGTRLDYPDSASFLEQMLLRDVPQGWVTAAVRDEVARVAGLSGPERQSAAAVLADRLAVEGVPVIPTGVGVQGEFFAPALGCRVFPPFGSGVDLAALCRDGPGS
jgi:ABC-type oligopeptide transport system substrate-binding subunit